VGRAVAVIEVLLVFALCHLTYRSLQQTPNGRWEQAAGQNYLPGVVMMAFALAAIRVHGLGFAEFGLSARCWRSGLAVGVTCAVLLVLIGGGIAACGLGPNTWLGSICRAGAEMGGTWAVLVSLRQGGEKRSLWNSRPAYLAALACLPAFLVLPAIVAVCIGGPVLWTASSETWLFLSGFAEEAFFRGYIQSRIDQEFGRPCRWLGMSFGCGLLLSALCFGLIHALNTVDYFSGRYTFAYAWAFWAVFIGLFFGCLRERTGSILAGGVAHGLSGVIAIVPKLLSAPT
jgi:membrane protease YdiL (CAAX protease family)